MRLTLSVLVSARLAVLALALLVAAPAFATPGQDFDRGRNSYMAKDYDSAYATLNSLLYPNVELARKQDIYEAYVLLGGAVYQRGDRERAIKEFRKALELDLETTPTTNVHTADVVRLYEDTRKQYKAELEIAKKKRETEEINRKIREYVNTIGVYERNNYGVNFVPFGAGQFQNKQRTKGYVVAGGMVASGGLSLSIYLYLRGKYSDKQVPLADVNRVNQLQQMQFVGAGVFWGFYIYGVIDAMINYKASRLVKGDDSLLPADFLDELKTPQPPPAKKPEKKASLRDRLRIGPFATSTGVGIGIGWETR
jgi:tetratricopeptide (TPR) repeat protein